MECQAHRDSSLDASAISIDQLNDLSEQAIGRVELKSAHGTIRLNDVFGIQVTHSTDDAPDQIALVLKGNLNRFDNLCSGTRTGATVVLGDVGQDFAQSQIGGAIYVQGSVGERAFSDKRDGLSIIGGDVADRFGAPLPGKLQGISGGDSIILGSLGNRACERMRRGTICVAGDIGAHLAHQWIAGTILAMRNIGPHWGAQMRRGSLIFCGDPSAPSAATLSPQRPLELSFLPILWKHLRNLLSEAAEFDLLSDDFTRACSNLVGRLPVGRQVLRSIADLECQGQGEVLILQESSVPE